MQKIPISVLVQTKNEEAGITRCVTALQDFEDVVVVDSYSTDRTAELAEAEGARVALFRWDGGYPKKKQWQLDHLDELGIRHEWIFFVDADERPTPELLRYLRCITMDGVPEEVAAIEVGLLNRFAGHFMQHGYRIVKRCIVRRGRVRFPEVEDLDAPGMGELEGHYQPTPDGKVIRARGLLIHDDPDSISTWFERHNRYSDWEAHLRVQGGHGRVNRNRTQQGRLFAAVPFKPVAFFIYSYIVRRGFLDGRSGFAWATAYSFYYWMIVVKERELRQEAADRTHHS